MTRRAAALLGFVLLTGCTAEPEAAVSNPELEYVPTAADDCVHELLTAFNYLAERGHSDAAFGEVMFAFGPQSDKMHAFREGWGHYAGSLPENRDDAYLAMNDHFAEFCNASVGGPGAGEGELVPVG